MMGITIRNGITNHEKCVFYHEKHGDSSRNKQEQCWNTYWRIMINFRNIWAAVCEGLMSLQAPLVNSRRDAGDQPNPFWLDDFHPLQWKGDHVVNMLMNSIRVLELLLVQLALFDGIGILLRQSLPMVTLGRPMMIHVFQGAASP